MLLFCFLMSIIIKTFGSKQACDVFISIINIFPLPLSLSSGISSRERTKEMGKRINIDVIPVSGRNNIIRERGRGMTSPIVTHFGDEYSGKLGANLEREDSPLLWCRLLAFGEASFPEN